MRIAHVEDTVQVLRTYGIQDGQHVSWQIHSETVFSPSRVTVIFFDGKFSHLSVFGRRVLKGGELGQQECINNYFMPSTVPEWAKPLMTYEMEEIECLSS